MEIIHNIPNHKYQKMPGISSSELRTLYFKSPFHYKYEKENNIEDEYKKFFHQGTLIHSLLLEPDKTQETLHVLPEHITDFRTTAARAERDKALQENKNVLLYKDYLQIVDAVEIYKKNSLVKTYLSEGVAEASVFWTDEETGIKCKCRPDYLTEQFLVDVKSCDDLDKFESSFRRYNYHVQGAHYLRGTRRPLFYILALCKQPPYDVELFVIGEDTLKNGDDICNKALRTFKECQSTNNWPNKYGQELKVLELQPRKETLT